MALPTFPLHAGPFTAADRDAIPDEGRRVELIDGSLLVSPSPGRAHNDAVIHLFRLLDTARPADVTVYNVPYDLALPDGSILVPDLLVAPTAQLGEQRMWAIPLLVVEVVSPSSRLADQMVKRAKYEASGIPAYWIVDPQRPTLTVLELEDGGFVTRHVLDGSTEEVLLKRPFPVSVHLPRPPDTAA